MSAVLLASTPLNARAGASGVGGKRHVSALAYNVYVGSQIDKVLLATTPEELVAAVTAVYYEMLASDPPSRMAAIADEIVARRPDVVSLVELTTVLVQSPGDWGSAESTPAEDLVFDFLQMLLDALEARGAHYTVAAVSTEFDIELPMMNASMDGLDDARIIDHEAILVRADLPPGHLRVTNPQSGHFQYIIEVPELGINVHRGWCSADVFMRGRTIRVVCAHPEPAESLPELNYLQVAELLEGLSTEPLPVILIGDFNTDPLQRDGSFSYDLFEGAGFTDAWNAVRPGDPEGGLTYGHDYYLSDPDKAFVWRIDLALYRGDLFTPRTFDVIDPVMTGGNPPFWPSDHAGIYTEFRLD